MCHCCSGTASSIVTALICAHVTSVVNTAYWVTNMASVVSCCLLQVINHIDLTDYSGSVSDLSSSSTAASLSMDISEARAPELSQLFFMIFTLC